MPPNTTPQADTRVEADAILEAARTFGKVHQLDHVDDDTILSVPEGRTIQPAFRYEIERREAMLRKEGVATLTTVGSFVEHVERHKVVGQTVVFVDNGPANPSMLAVYDYHESNAGPAHHGVHRARYQFPFSEEWLAWTDRRLERMSQSSFAEFLEDHLADVLDPEKGGQTAEDFAGLFGLQLATPNRLLAMSRDLTVHAKSQVRQAQNLATGEMVLHFVEEHTDAAGQQLRLPGGFVLAIPIFRGGEPYVLPARLRYRKSDGGLSWSIALHQPDARLRHAIDEAVRLVMGCHEDVPLFYGEPER